MKFALTEPPFQPKWVAIEAAWSDGNPFGRDVLPPYSDAELEDLFDEWGTPPSGRAFVRRARRDAPVREVESRRGNLISRYTPRKMNGRRQSTESLGPEYAAVTDPLQYGNLAPDICDRIVERGTQMRRLASQERQDALGRAYLAEHSALRGRGIYPSRRKVVAGMKAKCAISYRFPDLQRAQREAMRLAPVSKRRASVGTGVH